MDDVVNDFLVESHENLDRLDSAFLALEQDPNAPAVVADIFRTIHTIKGTCGFLGFGKLERLSHSGESLLARVRDGKRGFDQGVAQALFELVDAVRAILATIEQSGQEGEAGYEELIDVLRGLCDEDRPAQPPPGEPRGDAPAQAPLPTPGALAPIAAPPPRDSVAGRFDASIRVDLEQLDRLMNLVGELVLARNQILLHAELSTHAPLRASSQRLSQITSELQEGVMRTRMQPIGTLWAKLPRMVRDLGAQLDKPVELVLEGAKTAIDRSILEALRDPLTHLVRNAIDHGIEGRDVRAQRGKPALGRLGLRAWAEGGQVSLELADDGGGIDPELLLRRALERGVIDAEEAAGLSETDVLALIFRPGFSTAAQVSNLSGRGVGMDVVKTNVERLGGSVQVASRLSEGTRITLRIPLTLAILPVLMIECGTQRFALPSSSVIELTRIPRPGDVGAVETVQGARVLRLRGGLLPLIELSEVLELPCPTQCALDQHAIVLEVDGRRFGLVVDCLHEIQEIVVKPLGSGLDQLGAFAGATILGDGSVALILDVPGLAERGRVARLPALARAREASAAPKLPTRRVLLVDVPGFGRAGIDLARVVRLEEFARSEVELASGRSVLQWRGEVIPLLALDRSLAGDFEGAPASLAECGEWLRVVICSAAGRHIGWVVEGIVDVCDQPMELSRAERWSEGQAALHGRVTDLLDVEALATAAFDHWSRAPRNP